MPDDTPAAGAKTLDNGIRVLKAVAAHPQGLGVTELARLVGVHRTVAYRLLGTLTQHSLVSQGKDGHYRLGLGVVELSMSLRSDLRSVARPHLRDLAEATGATAHLTILDGEDAVSIAVVEPGNVGVHVAYRVGFRHSVTVGAAGLAILLGRPPQPGERREVTEGRRRGFAASQGELQSGAWGLAAPVSGADGESVASVGVIALGPLDEAATSASVLRAAEAIRRELPL
ncbi:IclR family transcriptional regulator [Amycolatopsis sp.]|jgi:DNA-binding IclR family transcriptional regulator|uniref:IclR family transcriptional regulator n=1 Tax=Amycolatopsis sp. TaxID=37632 RepID=UPI002E015875|nr:IclR family transcriptional regulator [Amycolatopsis sp.]